MSLEKINALKARLAQLPDLNAFCQLHYQVNPNHFIGLKSVPNAKDLPAIAYELRSEKITIGRMADNQDDVLLFIQINNNEESADGFTGLIHALEIAGIIVNAINQDQRIGNYFIEGEIEITPIYPRALPFFTVAMQLKIIN